MGRLGQVRPDVQEGYEQKQPGNAQDEPQPRPQALEVERDAAGADLAGEGGVDGGGLGLCH